MTPPLLIEILFFDGVDELAPFRVLRGAIGAGANFSVRLVTLTAVEEVTASCGLCFRPDGVLDEPDILVVPDGGWVAQSDIGPWGEAHRGTIPTAIAHQADGSAVVATVCTGTMLAAYGGLVTGRHAITHHAAIDDLRASGANVVFARVVDDSDLISAERWVSHPASTSRFGWSNASQAPRLPPRSNPPSNTSAAASSGAGSSLPCSFESKRVQSLIPAGIGSYGSP